MATIVRVAARNHEVSCNGYKFGIDPGLHLRFAGQNPGVDSDYSHQQAHMHRVAPILQADGLSFGYPNASDGILFDSLDVLLPPGVTWVSGDEGAGKTTLLQLLAGALPTTGQIEINGVSLRENATAYKEQVAWFDPRDNALDQHTARQLFSTLPQRYIGCDLDSLRTHLEGLSLAPHLDKPLATLSSGTRRKVLLAAALASQAAVILLDQPFMALDRPSIDYVLGVLAEAARHPDRAWVVADYEAPINVRLAGVLKLKR
jgi:ABC-type multidrug transport system ATPase subunit